MQQRTLSSSQGTLTDHTPTPADASSSSAAAAAASTPLRMFKRLDAHAKVEDDFRIQTATGAVISLLCVVAMACVVYTELGFFLQPQRGATFMVDTRRNEKLDINFDVTFPEVPCASLSLDTLDVMGEAQQGVDHAVFKRRLDRNGRAITVEQERQLGSVVVALNNAGARTGSGGSGGGSGGGDDDGHGHGAHGAHGGYFGKELDSARKRTKRSVDGADADAGDADAVTTTATSGGGSGAAACGSCYGSEAHEGQCCNTCDEVREAYRRKGWFFPSTVNTNIVQCWGESVGDRLKQQAGEGCQFYGKLTVNKVSGNFHFAPGDSFTSHGLHLHDLFAFDWARFNLRHRINHLSFGDDDSSVREPLDGEEAGAAMNHQYWVEVISTEGADGRRTGLRNEYGVVNRITYDVNKVRAGHGVPGVFFIYQLSPLAQRYEDRSTGVLEFLANVCAVVGGLFVVAQFVDFVVRSLSALVLRAWRAHGEHGAPSPIPPTRS